LEGILIVLDQAVPRLAGGGTGHAAMGGPSRVAPATAGEREFPFSDRDFRYLSSFVHERSGIVLGAHKRNMVYGRLARRLRELGLRSFGEYCELIQSDSGADEIGSLINAVTTNLTRFFREPHHFADLRHAVLRHAAVEAARGRPRRLRLWSAGCSSGEEPYSIAMTVADGLPGLAQWDVRILATDLDSSMVDRARTGRYPAEALADLPKATRTRHFAPERGGNRQRFVVADGLRRLIAFKELNLLDPWPMNGPFDAIFCRNVMIYFDAATKAELVRRFADLLKAGGSLYVGHSESLLDHRHSFQLIRQTIYRRVAS
jgi:chemotaxis protein methyltransferase CheR